MRNNLRAQSHSAFTSQLLASLLLFGVCGSTGRANIIINASFDPSITGNANAAKIEAGINHAVASLESSILTSTSVNILFADTPNGLGGAATYYNPLPYSRYVSDLASHQILSANDLAAFGSRPAGPTNPVNGNADVSLTYPLLRAIGETALGSNSNLPGQFDSTISLNLSLLNFVRTGPQDPNKYDLEQVALHEVNEVLGAGGAGSALRTGYDPAGPVKSLDFFRYGASGVRSFTTDPNATAYFSINSGVTKISNFNQDSGGDFGDSGNNAHEQVQDAFSSPGLQLNNGITELTELDVVGYNLEVVPEPSTGVVAIFAAGVVASSVAFRRRKTA